MLGYRATAEFVHTTFAVLPRRLCAGDLLVINTSGTLAAEIPGVDGGPDVHLSTRLPAGLWTIELRRDGQPFLTASAGEIIALPDGGRAHLLAPYAPHRQGTRLWIASLELPRP